MTLKQAAVSAISRPLLIAFFTLMAVHIIFASTAGVKMYGDEYSGSKVLTFKEYDALITKFPKKALEDVDKVVIWDMPYKLMIMVYVAYLIVVGIAAIRIQRNMNEPKKVLSMQEKRGIAAAMLLRNRMKRKETP